MPANRNGALFPEGPEFCGVMSFTYADDPLFHTMFPDTDIANIFGGGPGLEKSLARTPGMCVFCLRASE